MIIVATCSPGTAWAVPVTLADDAADLCSRFGVVEAVAKQAMRNAGSQLLRGVLGGLMKGKR